MREAMAVTGYVASSQLSTIKAADYVEVRPERDVTDVVVRVKGADIDEVREGGSEAGLTIVQLVLRTGATVETVRRLRADEVGMQAFYDPVLNRVYQEATAKKIMI